MEKRYRDLRPRLSFSLGVVCMILLLSGGGVSVSADQQKKSDWKTRVLTGKESLAGKASDEQRVNNCKVPMDKRGDKDRPDACVKNRL